MAKLGWIFGTGGCAALNVRSALGESSGNDVRRVACAPPTQSCACPVDEVRWGYDASPVLRQFGRETALDVVHLWDPPPIVLRWLKTGDESIREVARAAANLAAGLTANSTAYLAADSAAHSAADPAASSAAYSAARWAADRAAYLAADSAAYFAADSAAYSAAYWTANSTAYWAAYSAAYSAAQRKQSKRLAKLLIAGRKLYSQRSIP